LAYALIENISETGNGDSRCGVLGASENEFQLRLLEVPPQADVALWQHFRHFTFLLDPDG